MTALPCWKKQTPVCCSCSSAFPAPCCLARTQHKRLPCVSYIRRWTTVLWSLSLYPSQHHAPVPHCKLLAQHFLQHPPQCPFQTPFKGAGFQPRAFLPQVSLKPAGHVRLQRWRAEVWQDCRAHFLCVCSPWRSSLQLWKRCPRQSSGEGSHAVCTDPSSQL